MEFESRVCGIPCVIKYSVHGNGPCAELEWQVCDQRGRPADWLTRKMTSSDEFRVIDECWDHDEGMALTFSEDF
jgi:hypothetical protein